MRRWPIPDQCCLMHHKYIVLDGGTAQGRVWTGSTNLTDDFVDVAGE